MSIGTNGDDGFRARRDNSPASLPAASGGFRADETRADEMPADEMRAEGFPSGAAADDPAAGTGNAPAPARLTVGIVSAGRVGTALGQALERVGHVVGACSAVSDASVHRARTRLPESRILPVDAVASCSELLVLAVPDTELDSLVSGLAATGAVRPGTIVVHTSGARGLGVLAPLTDIVPIAMHPAMTFTGHAEDTARLTSACFGITAADEIGYAIAQALVLEMGGEPVRVRDERRALYHAALAHGSNHLVTLVADAVEALRVALAGDELLGQQLIDDDPGGVAERVLQPLLSAALDNALRRGQSALTGPVARGDAAAVATHLRVLDEVDPDLARGYRALSLRSAQRVHAPADVVDVLSDPAGGAPVDANRTVLHEKRNRE